MPLSNKDRILMWFDAHPLPIGSLVFDEVLDLAVNEALGLSGSDVSAFCMRHMKRYWSDYVQRIGECRRQSIYPHIHVIDHDSRRFEALYSHLLRIQSKRSSRLAGRLRLRPSLHKMLNGLNDREYEALCCHACMVSGAKEVSLTPKGNEGGIDFFALFEVPQGYLNCTSLGKVRIVGQAKLHNTRTPVGHIRDFNDTLNDVRKRSDSIVDLIPSWFKRSSAPIVGWFVCHAGFQEGSLSKARSNGVLLFDSRTLVEMIALAPTTAPEMSGSIISEKVADHCKQMVRHF